MHIYNNNQNGDSHFVFQQDLAVRQVLSILSLCLIDQCTLADLNPWSIIKRQMSNPRPGNEERSKLCQVDTAIYAKGPPPSVKFIYCRLQGHYFQPK